jgi:dCMP deaminase
MSGMSRFIEDNVKNPGGVPLPRAYMKAVTFMAIADELSGLSTCSRQQVGAIIVKDGRCISWGYNGAPPGMTHCVHEDDSPCETATHAEANAIAAAARQGISTDGAHLYVTVSPCATCSRLLIAAGIVGVTYKTAYRDRTGVEILQQAGVKVVD